MHKAALAFSAHALVAGVLSFSDLAGTASSTAMTTLLGSLVLPGALAGHRVPV